jgi:general secretion pathway protein L
MTSYQDLVQASSRWIDGVAATLLAGRDAFREAPRLRLVEQDDGRFILQGVAQKAAGEAPRAPFFIIDGRVEAAISTQLTEILRGAEVEFVLRPDRFMFRPLELPPRAAEFLEGIIRAQIDRLTPWSAADAAFGWRQPSTDGANERMIVTVAATSRRMIAPFVKAIERFDVDAIIVSAAAAESAPDADSIQVFEQKVKGAREAPQVRRLLIWLLAGAGALAAASVAASLVIGGDLETQHEDLMRRIAERRAAIQPSRDWTSEAALAMERRKHEAPSSVIVVEALSQILPDDTYLSELRILEDKMQIIGITRDAPSLIRLIEQSALFKQATFFAPTTRSPSETNEHFFIEAHINPVYTPSL